MAGKTTIKIMMLLAIFALATGCSDDDPAAPVSVDTAPPAIPANFTASFDAGIVTLSWDANTVDADLAGYLVEKTYDGQSSYLFASPTLDNSCVDDAVGYGVTSYAVYAIDFTGNESAVASATVKWDAPVSPGRDFTLP